MRMQRYFASFVVFCALVASGERAWAAPSLTFSPTSGDAGNVHVGNPSTTNLSFAGTSTGSPDAQITAWVTSGSNCGDFVVAPDPTGGTPITITAGNPQ